MANASHKKIQDISDLGIVQVLAKRIPQLTVNTPICLIIKATHLIFQPTARTDDVPIGTYIQEI